MAEVVAQVCPRCGASFPPEQDGPCPVCRDAAVAAAAPAAGSSSGPGEDAFADELAREEDERRSS